ncbi:antirestriction protein ArdA [Hyphococcus sp.]|uniref:antirestriction protein ArdA n=1 Tax=Hyphococcus sp. TaxID=2038636 RepID=UPI0035C6C01E
MSKPEIEIRIYVACLAAYNNGILHGRWIDALQDADAILKEIGGMLKASPIAGAEEFAIHDYEGFEGARIEEYQSIDSVAEIAEFIGEHGKLGGKLLEYFGDLEDARTAMMEDYRGEYSSRADFAQELTEETTEIPQALQYYIDYERMGRDLEINDVLAVEAGFEEFHIFWRR